MYFNDSSKIVPIYGDINELKPRKKTNACTSLAPQILGFDSLTLLLYGALCDNMSFRKT